MIDWQTHCLRRLSAVVAAGAIAIATAPAAWAGDLAQVVGEDEEIAAPGTHTVIDHGHVDVGAEMIDGEPQFLARDDSAATPVWRQLDDVVFNVGDASQLTVPEDKQFSFVGADPGEKVWVIPQTEQAGVPWVGWNTQAPSLVEATDRGITMEFLGHQGPGEFSLFLQNGGFEPPELLWSTAARHTQEFWVDLNTHTHANWTFTEPGIHQVGIRITGNRKDGTEFSSDGILTFAVGAGTDLQAAQDTTWDPTAAASTTDKGGVPTWIYLVVGAGALVLVLAIGLLLRSVARTRKGERHA